MSPESFDHLLSLITPLMSENDTKFRKSIPSNERLALTLRFLASEDSNFIIFSILTEKSYSLKDYF